MRLSVVIATLNRADALRDISLPSLLRQNTRDFEIVVWDASDDAASQELCALLSENFTHNGIALKYCRAPRKGLASQRNDAVSTTTGEALFFIDDDCEVSVDAVCAIQNCFASFPWLPGVGLPMLNKTTVSGNSALLQFASCLFGMKNRQLKRLINKSGGLSLPVKDLPGPAEWLSGGSMAYRRSVFAKVRFDERLEIFGGYALGEDVDFSHRVMLEFGQPHMIAPQGYVVHHAASGGGRNIGLNKIAAHFFNPRLMRQNFAAYGKRFALRHRLWAAIGTILLLLHGRCSPFAIARGARLAQKELARISKTTS